MHDLSLLILDLSMNCIRAEAKKIIIEIVEDTNLDFLFFKICDDGKGFETTSVEELTNPFYTTRSTRKVGLGLSLFKEMVDLCDGVYNIECRSDGSTVAASIQNSHINRPQMGDLSKTLVTLFLQEDLEVDFTYNFNGEINRINNKTIHEGEEQFALNYLKTYKQLKQQLRFLYGGEHEISRRFKEN